MEDKPEFDVIFELQPDGGYTAYVPDLPGCVSEGRTLEEATEMIRDAMAGYLDSLRDRGYEPPRIEHRKLAPQRRAAGERLLAQPAPPGREPEWEEAKEEMLDTLYGKLPPAVR